MSTGETAGRNISGQVSVVVPVRDPGPGFVEMLRAVGKAGAGAVVEILVVDDASATGREWLAAAAALSGVRVLGLAAWGGRAAARDAGARAACGEFLWFLDADCLPRPDALAIHLAQLADGADLSLGLAASPGEGFWGRYQATVLARRARAPAAEQSIANCVVRRRAYEMLGGLDTAFRHYGFEDRDFILRALAAGQRTRTTPASLAVHAGEVTLTSVCRKFNEAARLSAPRFAQRHPDAYWHSPLGRLDARARGAIVARCAHALSALQAPWQRLASACVASARVPYALQLVAVRGAIALAYLRGSCGLPLRDDAG